MAKNTADKTLRSYTLVLLTHHRFLASGREGDAVADAMEARLSELWERLDESQRQQARGMSSDLNWIRRGYALPPMGKKREEVTPEELNEFYRLHEAKDYLLLLKALRVCAAQVPPVVVALVRANSYLNLGFREMSEPFLKATIDLGINDGKLSRTAFDMLVQIRPAGAFEKASKILETPEKFAPISIAQAILLVTSFVGGNPTAFTRDDLAEMLRQADKRLDDEPTPHEERVRFLTAAGAQLGSFGFGEEGVGYLERALKLEPENAELLGWMGEAIYPKDRGRAVEMFKQSIALGTRLVRPHLHLANHFLAAKDYEHAKAYAAEAVERAGDSFSLSVALEVMAICLSTEGAPHGLILDLLRRATQLWPANKRAVANLASFKEFLKSKVVPAWETDEQESEFESRERWSGGTMKSIYESSAQ
jgi:tetratricopeptide (TPR) repeat protein